MSTERTNRGTYLAEALANESICADHYRLVLDVGSFPPTRPGQFVQLMCRPPAEQESGGRVQWSADKPPRLTQKELTDAEPLLRRPLSLAGRRDHAGGASELDIIYRRVGAGTRWLSTVQPGQPLSLLGPLGNAFAVRDDKPAAVLVGGGVGIPPLLYLGEALSRAGKTTAAFSGARTAGLLPLKLLPAGEVSDRGEPSHCVAEFAANSIDSAIATDDGSLGWGGFISEPFQRWLDAQPSPEKDVVVYTCGPEAMMHAISELCLQRDVECQVSLERHMACGMGTCQSCVCKIKSDTESGWTLKLCCTDGPVLDAREIIW